MLTAEPLSQRKRPLKKNNFFFNFEKKFRWPLSSKGEGLRPLWHGHKKNFLQLPFCIGYLMIYQLHVLQEKKNMFPHLIHFSIKLIEMITLFGKRFHWQS